MNNMSQKPKLHLKSVWRVNGDKQKERRRKRDCKCMSSNLKIQVFCCKNTFILFPQNKHTPHFLESLPMKKKGVNWWTDSIIAPQNADIIR